MSAATVRPLGRRVAGATRLALDPAVPARDTLLDPGAAARRLETTVGGVAIERCERLRVKYRVGESLRVLYRVAANGRSVPVSVRTFAACRGAEAFRRALESVSPTAPLPPLVHDSELGAVFWTFPNDRRLRDLPLLASPPALGRLLDRRLTAAPLVAYVPETSATARCVDESARTVAFAKVSAGAGAARARQIATGLPASGAAGTGALRLPRALSASEDCRALLMEPLAGTPLAALGGARLEGAVRGLGAALGALHGLPVPPGAPRHERLDGGRLHTAAGVIGVARPELAGMAKRVAARLDALDAGAAATRRSCLHGDPHLRNALVRPGGIALVDLDHVSEGPAEVDLARVLAGLAYLGALGRLDRSAERALARALLAGYARAGAPAPCRGSLRWHVAATLLARHAATAVSRFRPGGLERLEAVLGRAEDLIA